MRGRLTPQSIKTGKEKFMKKCKLLIVGLIGLLMAGGLMLAGCDDGGGYSPNEITTYCGGYCGKKTSECKTGEFGCTRKGNASGTCKC